MSRKLLRTGLAACALAALLAAPAHAAGPGDRSVDAGIWRWLMGMWQDTIGMHIDPDGSTAPTSDIGWTIDPDGDELNVPAGGGEGEIRWTLDPNG